MLLRQYDLAAQQLHLIDAKREFVHRQHLGRAAPLCIAEHDSLHAHQRMQREIDIQVAVNDEAAAGGAAHAVLDRTFQPIPIEEHHDQHHDTDQHRERSDYPFTGPCHDACPFQSVLLLNIVVAPENARCRRHAWQARPPGRQWRRRRVISRYSCFHSFSHLTSCSKRRSSSPLPISRPSSGAITPPRAPISPTRASNISPCCFAFCWLCCFLLFLFLCRSLCC